MVEPLAIATPRGFFAAATGLARRWGTIFAAALLCAGCVAIARHAAMARSASGDAPVKVLVDELPRTYLIHVPATAPAGGFPVILVFHGGGGQATGVIRLTRLDPLADRRGFLAVYPNGIGRHWNDGRSTIRNKSDDVRFVDVILDDLARRYPVDPARIYATGISNGAMFTERLGCERSGRFAAIAPVSGTLPADMAPSCRPAQPVSVLQIGGTADPIMPFNGGAVADFGGWGEGGLVLSVPDTVERWALADGCAPPAPPVALPPIKPADGTSVTQQIFAPCRSGKQVVVLTINGGGHTWPGGFPYLPARIIGPVSHQLDASEAIVDFLLSQPRRRS